MLKVTFAIVTLPFLTKIVFREEANYTQETSLTQHSPLNLSSKIIKIPE